MLDQSVTPHQFATVKQIYMYQVSYYVIDTLVIKLNGNFLQGH